MRAAAFLQAIKSFSNWCESAVVMHQLTLWRQEEQKGSKTQEVKLSEDELEYATAAM